MSADISLDLVVPLFNEEANVEKLVEDIAEIGLVDHGLRKLILVNNGSVDNTEQIVRRVAAKYEWIEPVTLSVNQMYGGGVYAGLIHAKADYIGMMPGDNQVHPSDVLAVWESLKKKRNSSAEPHLLVKGRRTVRYDGMSTRVVSWFYNHYVNLVLGLRVADVNGLPKVFHNSLVNHIPDRPDQRMRTFTLDAQILDIARCQGWQIIEIPVTFLARRSGVSSWATKRLRTYRESAAQIWKLRQLRTQASGSQSAITARTSQPII